MWNKVISCKKLCGARSYETHVLVRGTSAAVIWRAEAVTRSDSGYQRYITFLTAVSSFRLALSTAPFALSLSRPFNLVRLSWRSRREGAIVIQSHFPSCTRTLQSVLRNTCFQAPSRVPSLLPPPSPHLPTSIPSALPASEGLMKPPTFLRGEKNKQRTCLNLSAAGIAHKSPN